MLDNRLLDMVKVLTHIEEKSLNDKGLKLFEEGGELAQKIISYLHPKNPRSTTRHEVIEEVVDCMLVVMSVAFDKEINATEDEVRDMLITKMTKWAAKQTRNKPDEKYPAEVHITVDASTDRFDVEVFKTDCKSIGVKPIVLDLELNEGAVMKDVMTSSTTFGTDSEMIDYANKIEEDLTKLGYICVRRKIETVPWHHAAPQSLKDNMPANCYFEAHLGVRINHNTDRHNLNSFKLSYGKAYDIHVSKNVFKKAKDGAEVVMLTLRDYATSAVDFKARVDNVVNMLSNRYDLYTDKVIIEFALLDTKISHDKEWISSGASRSG